MKTIVYAAALVLAGFCAHASHAAESYEALVARLKAGDVKVDYTALRDAYATSPHYQPESADFDKPRQDMIAAFNAKDCAKAIGEAAQVLVSSYIDIVTHLVSGRCYEDAGDAGKAEYHRAIARGLMESILSSGDGKSMKTAYVVVTVTEEYDAMRALHLRLKQQSLAQDNGHSYDAMQVTTGAGAAATVYFQIDRPMEWLSHALLTR